MRMVEAMPTTLREGCEGRAWTRRISLAGYPRDALKTLVTEDYAGGALDLADGSTTYLSATGFSMVGDFGYFGTASLIASSIFLPLLLCSSSLLLHSSCTRRVPLSPASVRRKAHVRLCQERWMAFKLVRRPCITVGKCCPRFFFFRM